MTEKDFENILELDNDIEGNLPVTEIVMAGYLEVCGMVYRLVER